MAVKTEIPTEVLRPTTTGAQPFPVLIHIGLHKTATTLLQGQLFNDAAAGFAMPFRKDDEIHDNLVLPDALDFDADRARAYFWPRSCDVASRGQIPVFSSENLSGNPHAGAYDRKELAGRLHAVFPGGKVLIVIREQRSMLLSTYKQYIRVGGLMCLRDYMHVPAHRRITGPSFVPGVFHYDKLIALYQGLFGCDNTLVLPYELLCGDGADFIGKICRFADAKGAASVDVSRRPNASRKTLTVAIKRYFNPFLRRDPVNGHSIWFIRGFGRLVRPILWGLDRFGPDALNKSIESKWKSEIDAFAEQYRGSNERTAQLIDEDISRFGYGLPTGRGD